MTTEVPVPARIRRAALTLFAARGFDATGIREIAEAAAIPTSLLYHYRRSKEEILRDLMLEGLSRHLESSRRAVDLARSPEEALRAMVAVHVLVPVRNPEMARLMESEVRSLSPASQQAVGQRRVEGDARWESVLRSGVDRGVFEVPDIRLGRRLLRRLCTGVWLWYAPESGPPVEEVVAAITDHALAFVRAARDGRPIRGDDVTDPAVEAVREIVDTAHRDELLEPARPS